MMDDTIAASSTTLTKMAKKVREVCVPAVERMRRRTADQQVGGRGELVVVDESHLSAQKKGMSQ